MKTGKARKYKTMIKSLKINNDDTGYTWEYADDMPWEGYSSGVIALTTIAHCLAAEDSDFINLIYVKAKEYLRAEINA